MPCSSQARAIATHSGHLTPSCPSIIRQSCTSRRLISNWMSYIADDARRQLLEDLGSAVDQLGLALASLGEAYQEVDEATGETLEEQLFRPVRSAYATARRTSTGFAQRHGLPSPAPV